MSRSILHIDVLLRYMLSVNIKALYWALRGQKNWLILKQFFV